MKLLNGDQREEVDLAFCSEIFRDSEIFQTESIPTWFRHTLRLPADVRFTIEIWNLTQPPLLPTALSHLLG